MRILSLIAGLPRPPIPRNPEGWCSVLGALLLVLSANLPIAAATGPPTRELLPGLSVELELAAEQTHHFAAELAAGPWRVTAWQRGVDVVLSAWDPAGELLSAVDSPLDRLGDEVLMLSATAPGRYRVEVRAREAEAPVGRYRLMVEALPTGAADHQLLAALTAVTEAGSYYLAGGAEGWRAAAAAHRRARSAWRHLGEHRGEARALYCAAVLLRLLGERRQAIALGEEVLPLWRQLGEDGWLASTLNELGLNHLFLDETTRARHFFEQALAVRRVQVDRAQEAVALTNVCVTFQAEQRLREALACHERALAIFRELAEPATEAAALSSVGRLYYDLGEPLEALDRYRQALPALLRADNLGAQGITLDNIAVAYRSLGRFREAFDAYQEALVIFRRLEDRRRESRTLHNLGTAYCSFGEPTRGMPYLRQALAVRGAAGDARGEASSLDVLAHCSSLLEGPETALPYYQQALDRLRSVDHAETLEASVRVGWSSALLDLRRLPAARRHLDTAMTLLAESGDRRSLARAWEQRGRLELLQARPQAALETLERALTIHREIRHVQGQVPILNRLTEAERALGDLAAAGRFNAETVDLVESLRGEVGSPELRAVFLASQRRAYELAIELAIESHTREPRAGHDRVALELSERARARTLLELLGHEPPGGSDPTLTKRRRELRQRLDAKTGRRLDRLARGLPVDDELELVALLRELEEVEEELRRLSPSYRELTRPRILGAGEIQDLLDPDTVLLEIALGEERSHLWLISPTSLESHQLPARRVVEELARRTHEELSSRRLGGARETAAAELGRLLLQPIADRLTGRRLAVVADGALHYVPFGALPSPADPESPLILHHEVVHLPSASALGAQRRERPSAAGPLKRLAILADPVFDARDPRVRTTAATSGRPARPDPPAERGEAAFDRLLASRHEAEEIAEQAPTGEVWQVLDFAVHRDLVLGAGLAGYRIVHFATHGLFDARNPALSGLVLSRVDEDGRPRDGFLRLDDVIGLEIDAELVVLSGCRTALGREIRGEGLVGLTRGFMYAGVPRVLASLWRVQDRATARLMAELYRAMWAEGQRPSAALRSAQLAIREERLWRDPYYWAAFSLQGDWR